MQGETAPATVIDALQKLEAIPEVDTIIIARGGGSMEDLWCFNNEALIRAIFKLKKPVISAIGHETDFTLCDFVADLRAPTPTAAAELAVPDAAELKSRLAYYKKNNTRFVEGLIAYHQEQLDHFKTQLDELLAYTLTLKEGKKISSTKLLQPNDEITTRFVDGEINSIIK